MTRWVAQGLVLALVLMLAGASCKRSRASTTVDRPQAPIVRDDSEGFLLTWIDDKGDFHVETRVGDVPMTGRDAVRVVEPGKEDSSPGEQIFAADLRQVRPDGTYPVRTMSRSVFEAIAVARREKGGPTLANDSPPPSANTPTGDSPAGSAARSPRALVVIYGAEWCGACHDAARYLRRKGVAYVEKDVEKDPSAAHEMQAKLAKQGLHTASIPVLDVRGKMIVGFNPAELDAALGEAL